ncbi:MAG: IS200/IS605 family transposase [Candidatus Acidiferrales bacterium]
MPHTYTQNAIHVVFNTKDRAKLIPKDFQSRLWSYAAGICQNDKIFVHAIGGMDNHIHLLIEILPTLALAKAVNAVKSNSSRWANEEGFPFAWQQGYAAFSVSASNVPAVMRYIQNQESHHKKMSFEVEFIALLKKHGVEHDPKFVFS